MSDGRIASTDLKNGIAMLQNALWMEYRQPRIERHAGYAYTTHVKCGRCGASWAGDTITRPDRHEGWCPLAWAPDLGAMSE